jgi:ADP-ribose pyrophosphatase YjhB (NUDIX family)
VHQQPRIRVSGLILSGDGLLLIRHEKDGRPYWLLPGGGVEPGETLERALFRELQEECGLDDVTVVGPAALVESIAPHSMPDGKHVVHLVFHVAVPPGALAMVSSSDATVRNHRIVRRRELPDVDLRPPIQRFLERFEPGDPFVSLGRFWST